VTPDPRIAAFLKALDETQFLPPERLRAYQRRLLAKLLEHARRETDFYADRLAPVFRADGTVDWERWREIPILTRNDVQEGFDALTARSLPPAAGEVDEDSSSGSTGIPVRHLTTAIQNVASACASERFFNWHGLDPRELTVRIRAAVTHETYYPHGMARTGWRIGHPDSQVIDLNIATRTEQQIEWLERVRPKYLASYPSNLREIARLAEETGARLRYDAVLTFGEMVSADARLSILDCFGVEPLDRYGSSEVGHIAATCAQSQTLHIAAELVLLEILDKDGAPVVPGTEGRIVVTPFYNLAMPLIRYEVGDYGIVAAEPCGCGRTLPVLEKVLGRTRNIFRFADGSSVWPVLLSRDLRRFVSYRQFQVVQISLSEIELRYVPTESSQTVDVAGITEYARQRFKQPVSVTVTPVRQIGRSAGGKFEDYISLVV